MVDGQKENEKLEKVYRLVKKNNDMLVAMRNAKRREGFFKLLQWVVVIILAVVAYLYIEPYLDQLREIYLSAQDVKEKTRGLLEQIPKLEN